MGRVMAKPFTVIGLQRSGTNFVEECLRRCANAKIENKNSQRGIWKHGFEFDQVPDNNLCLVHKHPVSWIDSIRRQEEDLIRPAKPQAGRTSWHRNLRTSSGELDFERLACLWDAFHKWWLLNFPSVTLLRYETLIESEKRTQFEIIEACKMMGVDARDFEVPRKVNQSKALTPERRMGYVGFVFDTGPREAQRVLENVSPFLMRKFGYGH